MNAACEGKKPLASPPAGRRRPNIVLFHADQHRGDALSIEGHPDVMTPNLDERAARGVRFRNAYTPAPICSPARRSLLTGHTPATDGGLSNAPVRIAIPEDTLPNLLRRAGYETVDIGRGFHQHPSRARYGFERRDESPFHASDSRVWTAIHPLCRTGEFTNWPHLLGHGMTLDGYAARPWPYDEAFHQTTWTINKAIDFLENRDPDAPFFLSVGTVAPHSPLVPPACYFDRYLRKPLTPPPVGDWVVRDPRNARGLGQYSGRIPLGGDEIQIAMAGYYGLINHLDDQLFNLLQRIDYLGEPTYFIYLSDHGEMLGDHGYFRKLRPYQGSLHVPFFMCGPDIPSRLEVDAPVALQDLLPTVCDLVGVPIPPHVEGASLVPFFHGRSEGWRDYVHAEQGESAPEPFHCLTDGRWKYIWFSKTGGEQVFHLEEDPHECRDLSASEAHAGRITAMRERLVAELRDREEGFVREGRLISGCAHRDVLSHAVAV